MSHEIVPEAEAILDQIFPVLDKGFVRLVDYNGGDNRIVQAARVSYGAGTKTVREDAKLIDYLLKHEHMSPFEMVNFTFHIKLPIFCLRQIIRHRTARVNEISARYSVLEDEFYIPSPTDIKKQNSTNKQGRSEEIVPDIYGECLKFGKEQERDYAEYKERLNIGMARELARINLPVSIYTQLYWNIDLRNMFNFLKLRLDQHAQQETREYAKVLADLVQKVVPLAFASFEEHILYAVKFSRSEIEAMEKSLHESSLSSAK
jgi:thymidylate synthase (FAD)